MRVRFWGTRGSLPIALTAAEVHARVAKALYAARGQRFASLKEAELFAADLPFAASRTFGGHTSCVEVELSAPGAGPGAPAHEYVICDLGSGVRAFGNGVLARHGAKVANTFHIFLSHPHWDHIMGFPFFAPAYIPGNVIRIYGGHAELELAFRRQQAAPSFPVDFSQLGATIEFVHLEPGRAHQIAGMTVHVLKQYHAGDSYGYRFERGGRTLVYSTDSEHRLDQPEETERFVEFFRNADVVVFDAMYSLADAISVKQDWGHSSPMMGVELCQLAGARKLLLFHHEPVHDDERLAAIEAETRELAQLTQAEGKLDVVTAYDGLELTV